MTSDETSARLTLRLAGVLQEVRDAWTVRLDAYFNQLDDLVQGEWFDSSDIGALLKESRMASKEALHGLGNDLSAEIIHASSGIITRFADERASLSEEIADLRGTISQLSSGDDASIRMENEALRRAFRTIPEFRALEILQRKKKSTYKEIASEMELSAGKLRKHIKNLEKKGYVSIDKDTRPHSILFISSPWDISPSVDSGAKSSRDLYEGNVPVHHRM
ncbi:MAG: winged helix-turn-helix transcriptional regulator [Candidatus Lokiarchaeota archaeon]|nr:winged helix-turn-helix transcriptional regulator [Candidatus Lokiarchaeota archaeon]